MIHPLRSSSQILPTQAIPVIMVHGIFDTGKKLGTLHKNLRKAGYKCLAPDLSPSSGREGLTPLTQQLEHYISKHLGEKKPYHLLGYSMGGIIAREYLRISPNREYCQSLTCIASPHKGTKIAHLYPFKAGIELRPDSDFLQRLNNSALSYHNQSLSIKTRLDGMIIPSSSCELQNAKNLTFMSPTHPSLLINPAVRKAILAHLKAAEKANSAQALP